MWSYLGYFGLLWWLWASHTFYADRYDTDDLVYRLLATAQMVAIVIAAASLSGGPSGSPTAFAVSYTLARISLIAMYYRAYKHVEETRRLVSGYLIGFGIGAAVWAVSILVPAPGRYALWAIGITIELMTPWVMRREQARVPLDVSHLPERFGLFTILVLGESVAAVIVGLSHVEWSAAPTIAGILGVGIAAGLWWMYFDNVEGTVVRRRDADGRAWRPTAWIYAHLGLAAGVAMVGVGMEHAVVNSTYSGMHDADRWLLVGAFALALGAMALIHQATLPNDRHRTRFHRRLVRNRLIGIPVVLVIGLMSFLSPVLLVLLVLLVAVGEVILDLYAWGSLGEESG